MLKDITRINVEITTDTWKKLKVASVLEGVTLQEVVRKILDRAVSKRVIDKVELDI